MSRHGSLKGETVSQSSESSGAWGGCAGTTETRVVAISVSQLCTVPQGGDKMWVNFQADGKVRDQNISYV